MFLQCEEQPTQNWSGQAVPNYYLAKTQPRERAWSLTAGKEDPFELDSSPTL